MGLFSRNPNEVNYVNGKKNFTDVIKNTGHGDLLIWLNGEEDFNNNSTLIVAESEEALFFKDGIVEQVFSAGKYKLSTENYPFLSRFRNAFSGGISTFNCKVYFVRKAHSMEIKWGTDSPIQVRDPILKMATNVQARGAFKIQIDDSKKFLIKLLGNNVAGLTQQDLTFYFRSQFIQAIKSNIARGIIESDREILGINAYLEDIATEISPKLETIIDDYGIKLINFTIQAIDIPQDDPSRQRIEEAYATRTEDELWGDNSNRLYARGLLSDVANNPGSGGMANMGAGMAMGMGAAPVFGNMAQQAFAPVQNNEPRQQENNSRSRERSRRYSEEPAQENNKVCSSCSAPNIMNAKFCCECGNQFASKKFCTNCGFENGPTTKFCSECGTNLMNG